MIVDATGCVLGRLATRCAKAALNGQQVIVVNAEKAIISGRKATIFRENREKISIKNLGNPRKGPFHQKRPDKYLRRTIRGMLPYKKERGRKAFKRVMVYIGFPEDLIEKRHNIKINKKDVQSISEAEKDLRNYKTLGEVCKAIGGNW